MGVVSIADEQSAMLRSPCSQELDHFAAVLLVRISLSSSVAPAVEKNRETVSE